MPAAAPTALQNQDNGDEIYTLRKLPRLASTLFNRQLTLTERPGLTPKAIQNLASCFGGPGQTVSGGTQQASENIAAAVASRLSKTSNNSSEATAKDKDGNVVKDKDSESKDSRSESSISQYPKPVESKILINLPQCVPKDSMVVQVLWLGFQPSQLRGLQDGSLPPAQGGCKIGGIPSGYGIGRVLCVHDKKESPCKYQPGDLLWGDFGWQRYRIISDPDNVPLLRQLDKTYPHPQHYLSIFSAATYTAWFGWNEVASVPGKSLPSLKNKVVVVSSAAGGVGQVVCQLALKAGCIVIAITSSKTKAAFLMDHLKIRHVVVLGSGRVYSVDPQVDYLTEKSEGNTNTNSNSKLEPADVESEVGNAPEDNIKSDKIDSKAVAVEGGLGDIMGATKVLKEGAHKAAPVASKSGVSVSSGAASSSGGGSSTNYKPPLRSAAESSQSAGVNQNTQEEDPDLDEEDYDEEEEDYDDDEYTDDEDVMITESDLSPPSNQGSVNANTGHFNSTDQNRIVVTPSNISVAVNSVLQHIGVPGVDIYWDNVGGEISDQMLLVMNRGGRVVACGKVNEGNNNNNSSGPGSVAGNNFGSSSGPYRMRNCDQVLLKQLRWEGFLVTEYLSRFPEAESEIKKLVADNELKFHEDIEEGLENCPKSLGKLFLRQSVGKVLVKMT